MPHMVAEEFMAYYVIDPALPRTHGTIASALSAIGSTPKTLVLTFSGDGVWTIGANLTIPATVTLYIPPGVTVNRGAGVTLTINGPILASGTWETGTGTTVRGTGSAAEISVLKTSQMTINSPLGANGFILATPGLIPQIQMFNQGSPNASPGISLVLDPGTATSNWVIGNNPNLNAVFYVSHVTDNPHLGLNNTGLWIGNGTVTMPSPMTHLLQLQLDDAFKPNDGSWDFPSDERLKIVQRDATEGLSEIQAMPTPVWFRWNGKGGTDASAPEQLGWLAQQTAPIVPYLFNTYEDKLDPADADTTTLYSGNYSPLLPLLVNAVKALAARVEALEALTGARFATVEQAAHTHTGTGSASREVPLISHDERAAGDEPEAAPHPPRRRRH